jgi:branched-chain amino acid aminotransferase
MGKLLKETGLSVREPYNMLMWSSGGFFQEESVSVSSFNWTLHYGGSAWEGIRSYLDADQVAQVFMLERHIDRLLESAQILRLGVPYTKEELMTAIIDLQARHGQKELYFRPIVYRRKNVETNNDVEPHIGVDIYAFELPNTFSKEGIKVATATVSRNYPEFEMQCKSSNNYGQLMILREDAKRLGVDDVLLKSRYGHYTESSTANLFVVLSSGEIITPPSDGSILPGITRSLIGQQLQATEKVITRPDLITAQEVFITGTYAEVTPIIEFDGYVIGTGKRGPVVELAQKWYDKAVRNTAWFGGTGL